LLRITCANIKLLDNIESGHLNSYFSSLKKEYKTFDKIDKISTMSKEKDKLLSFSEIFK